MDWCVYHCRYGYRKYNVNELWNTYIYIPNNSAAGKSKGL